MKYTRPLTTILLLLTFNTAWCHADSGTELCIYPARVNLNGQADQQTLVVQLVNSQGITRDVTGSVSVKAADAGVIAVEGQTIRPHADGETTLIVELGQIRQEVPVVVKQGTSARAVSFRLDVMPIFMKHGCNNGSCHGAARGKDGFHLSLFGYDPAGDYYRLTRQLVGRRIDLAVPEQSLLLEKSLGAVNHTGGKRFAQDSEDYRTLLRWLQAGAPDDNGDTPEPLGIELLPPKTVFAGKDQTQATVVMAKYSDGTVRDVTRLALFLSNNDAVAGINKEGVASGTGRGGAFVFARFNKFTVGSEVLVLPTDDSFRWPDPPEANYIDTLVFDKLKKLQMAPAEVADDETFLRRAYLDLVGLPPSRKEYDRFLSDPDTHKREKLIDQLLERD
ncbi:MAG TPA: DUF1549 domain-containing protein, partial [Planctomycetaceae bacterium]